MDVTSRDRPVMPAGYGIPESSDGLLEWETVAARLIEAPQYWMATTRPDGRPHVVPRWGAWIDGQLLYDGSPETVHARNLRSNPACTLHIGDGWEVVTIDGTARASEPLSGAAGEQLAAEIGRKYGPKGYTPEPDAWSGPDAGGLLVLTPITSLAWFDFPNDLTRFHFG